MKSQESRNALYDLQVIDRLEVGPVSLQKQRVVIPYKIIKGDKTHQTELIFKFEENVFDPQDVTDLNLASLMGAQVAVNYGLFCKEIFFSGYFDLQDKRWLKDIIENTSREIYVNRLLVNNPFLKGPAENLTLERFKIYTQADIHFDEIQGHTSSIPWKLWEMEPVKHGLLSSGGKDSLLSFAVLHEAGKEVHPIFINESGRHWFTALNAYRHFRDHVPHTARVWTNSDRVFNWMLRHLDFIRSNFQDIRSDMYPLRLWTVAVFLFAALPLLKKRGIGRLVIGDEYDTTIRGNFKGITHYAGLYDQSRYFDNAMSRFFMAKGWNMTQFSVVGNLFELLIEKILVERYPDLQKQQVSCHAAHKQGDRVHPCGVCEKCRRIVGMMTALGADPKHAGYTDNQVENVLKTISRQELHQEAAAVRHMRYLLKEKGLLTGDKKNMKLIKPQSEVLHLRFDREKAPLHAMPVDLRQPLFTLYMQHAEGILKRRGRRWEEYDPLADPDFHIPYPFEMGGQFYRDTLRKKAGDQSTGETFLFGELTWPRAKEYLEQVDVALLPVGAIEQHGLHLPLDTDAYDADYLARQVAASCSKPRPIVLPLIPYGVSYHHDDFPGTISINNETLSRFVYEIGMSAAGNGIKKLVIINGHGGNGPALNFAAQMINRDARILVCVDSGETSDVDIYDLVETPNDVHAGEFETSTSLAIRPHLVEMGKARPEVPEFSIRYLNFTSNRGISWYAYTDKLSETGVMGDPTRATAEKGKKMWQIMIAHLVALVEELKRLSLDEIYQRRY